MIKKKDSNKTIIFKKKSLILYAPGVHTGGGFVLIKNILENIKNSIIFVDERLKLDNYNKSNIKIKIFHSLLGRIIAEFKLLSAYKKNKKNIVFCFHGIPPFFLKKNKNIVLFLQNSLHFEKLNYLKYPFKTLVRLFIEKLLLRILIYKVGTFVVQTPNMKKLLIDGLLKFKKERWSQIKIIPLVPKKIKKRKIQQQKKLNFIYVAEGLPHKNHKQLIDAWVELSKKNITPTLTLTIGSKYKSIIDYMEKEKKLHKLKINNLGQISQENLVKQYDKASALIYPSYSESFGLPLLEASSFNLPIIASELDFVRDVCNPHQTFNPKSHISISKAVERFLNLKLYKLKTFSDRNFVNKILNTN